MAKNLGRVGLVLKGDWDSGTTYDVLDVVRYDGSIYVAKVSNTDVQPDTDGDTWMLWVVKGDKGDTGDPATVSGFEVEYQASDSGTEIPEGEWTGNVPVLLPGQYLWCRTTITWSDSTDTVSYSVGYKGLNGDGSGDMVAADYDPVSAVYAAGGIPAYVSGQISSFESTLITGQSGISAENGDDYLLIYSATDAGNTKEKRSAFLADVVSHECIRVTTPSISSLPQTFNATGVTADMVVQGYTLSDASAQGGNWTITTAAGRITVAGTIITGKTTTLTLVLAKPSADVTATV